MRSLGLDVGTTNVKAVVVEVVRGGVRTVARAATPTPVGGRELLAAVGRLVSQVGADVDVVGVASMAETGVPVDDDGAPLGDLVRWDPSRAGRHADSIAGTYGAAELFAATGVRPSGKVPLATWAYLRDEEPDRWVAMRRWAGAADLVVLALTGRLVTDHTLAGRTMAYRLPEPGADLPAGFDPDLLAAVGLRPEQLPEVAGPATAGVPVGADRPWGLRPGTPVVVAGHDHQVGAWAAGVREPGEVADSVGTAESVIRVVGRNPALGEEGEGAVRSGGREGGEEGEGAVGLDGGAVPRAGVDRGGLTDRSPEERRAALAEVAAAGMSIVRTVGGRHEALVAGSSSAGATLAWWAERVGGYAALTPLLAAAAALERRADAPLLLPYLRGRQAPQPDPAARAVVVGASTDDVALTAAVVDGLALQARWMATVQADLAGADPAAGEVRVLGSAARDGSAWLRAKASAGPARLRVVTEEEAVAVGAALVAAHRAGLAEAAVLDSDAVTQRPEPVYDELYARFVEAARTAP